MKSAGIPGHTAQLATGKTLKGTHARVGVSHPAHYVLLCLPGISGPFKGPVELPLPPLTFICLGLNLSCMCPLAVCF